MDQATALTVVPEESRENLMRLWTDWMVHSRGLLPNTVKLYTRAVETAWDELQDLPEASMETLERWVQTKGGKAGTVANRITSLCSFYRFLVKTKRRPDNPTAEMDRPKIHKRLPKPVEDLDDVLLRLDEIDRRAIDLGTNHGRYVGQSRDMAVFLCETGLRIHEAVKCDWPVPCPSAMKITGKGNKEALVPITEKAQEAWNRLGTWPVGARATQRRFERVGFTPHMCRHWRATSLVRAGADFAVVSKIMRHASMQTTMEYAAFQQDQMKSALALVP